MPYVPSHYLKDVMVFVELKKRVCKFATKLAVSIEHNVNVKGNSGNYA